MADTASVSYQRLPIRCGKSNCRCNTSDQTRWHGPYGYAYWTDPKTGQPRSKYVGKNFSPPDGKEHTTYSERRPPPDDKDAQAEAERVRREREARERAERERKARAEQEARQNARNARRAPTDEEDAACPGVRSSVTQEELKKAWRRKMQKHTPTATPRPSARDKKRSPRTSTPHTSACSSAEAGTKPKSSARASILCDLHKTAEPPESGEHLM